nr:tRNA (adenosine(37)-N6)-dimethylallyltransferase MiaA [Neochlamydia sp. AcF65]
MTVASGTLEKEEIEQIFINFAIEAQKQLPTALPQNKKRVIIIAGPTGCGKSHFALQLARKIHGEIVSADSMQVYKGMDIGTAKPTLEERQQISHHLIDICHLADSFNVVDFCYEARQAFQRIHNRDKVPIVVGGAGFYIHSLLYGPPLGPPSIPEIRKALEEEYDRLGPEVLYARLQQLDPHYASGITKNDKQKIVRALEIITLTGEKVSKLSWKGRHKAQNYDFRCWFLFRPRPHLYHRIENRCDQMIEEGLLEEVQGLLKKGLLANSSAAQAIGYKQAIAYLATDRRPEDYLQFVETFKRASRNYAKRQHTWFGKEPLFNWIDMDLYDTEMIADLISKDIDSC